MPLRNSFQTYSRCRTACALILVATLTGCAAAGVTRTSKAPGAHSTPPPPAFSGKTHRGEIVSLPSHSPAGFDLIISDGRRAGSRVKLAAELSLPEQDSNSGEKLPAMILIHGSGGISEHGLKYVDLLNGMGVATLRIDSFTGRGVTSTVGAQDQVSESMMVTDALRGLALLAANDNIDPRRIGIIGWSKGGGVALLAAWDEIAQIITGSNDLRFASHTAYYPPCFIDLQEIDLASAPVRILIGENDQWTPAAPCRSLARRLDAKNMPTELTIYPGAEHSFDSNSPAQDHPDGFNYAGCQFSISREGRVRDLKTGIILDAPEKTIRAITACGKKGTRTAPNPRAARKSLIELRKFVSRTLLE